MTTEPGHAEAAPEGPAAAAAEAAPASLADAVRQSRLGQLDLAQKPSGGALLAAVGGVRGLIESLLPGMLFLVLFTITKNVALSVLVPLGVSVIFVLVRVITKGQSVLAFAGLIGVGVSALIAILTDRPEDNFLWGFIVNSVVIVVILVTMVIRKPLIGLIVGLLRGEVAAWQTEPAKKAVAWRATIMWLVFIAARLLIQVPLWAAGLVEALGVTKLLMGVPLYAAVVWVTWLMVRTVIRDDAEATR